MDIHNNGPTVRSSTTDPQCSICLDDLTNTCSPNTCLHLYCFECLQRWSNECLQECPSSAPTCPLCKKTFIYIYHSFDGLGSHETYAVPILGRLSRPRPRIAERAFLHMSDNRPIPVINVGPFFHMIDNRPIPVINVRPFFHMSVNRMFSTHSYIYRGNEIIMSTLRSSLSLEEMGYNHGQLYHHLSQNYPRPTLQTSITGLAMRIQVYVDNAWAQPLPNSTGHFRHCTYRDHPTQMHRLHDFCLRDVVAIRESLRLDGQANPFPENTDIYLTNVIIQSLAAYEIRELHLIHILRHFLNTRLLHFCHELYNFAYSPYEIFDYDRNVQYTNYYYPHNSELTAPFYQEQSLPTHIFGETMVLDSDNEELQMPNIIEINSNTNNSDFEILSHSSHRYDPLNSASIYQPSTSTGIQYSLDRPNNSFSVHGGISRVSDSSQVRRD